MAAIEKLTKGVERVLVVGLLITIAWQLLGLRSVESVPTAELAPGTELPNVALLRVAASGQADPVELAEIFGDRCGLMVFFLSTCPFCERMGSAWSNVAEVHIGDAVVPIVWTDVSPVDTGAAAFVAQHDLANPYWYQLNSDQDRRSLGVAGWPRTYVISPGPVFEGRFMSRDPALPDSLPASCRELN
jgi:hypothetical protein